jgi:hypothetical protein
MNDRELLEMAAKAAGIEYTSEGYAREPIKNQDGHFDNYPWNPLRDDGDALRLAVKLKMAVVIEQKYGHVYATVDGWRVDMEPEEPIGNDPYAATRRAIVRAAAEIGRME